jgi:PAS domain S-box-containing protein
VEERNRNAHVEHCPLWEPGESELQLQRLLGPLGIETIMVLDMQGHLLSINPAGMRVLGIEDEALFRGKSWSAFWDQASQPLVREAVRSAREGRADRFEGFFPTLKGAPKWWEVIVMPVWPPGDTSCILAMARDITERKRAEIEQQEQAMLAKMRLELSLLMSSDDPLNEVLERCVCMLKQSLPAEMVGIWTLNAAAQMLELQACEGLTPQERADYRCLPPGAEGPGRVTTQRLYCAELQEAWPALKRVGKRYLLVYPLDVGDRLTGALVFCLEYMCSPAVQQALHVMANTIAVGIEHRRSEEALRFLLRASTVIASSLKIEETVQQAVELAVPTLADFCFIDLLSKDVLSRVACTAVPELSERCQECMRYVPTRAMESHPVIQAIRSREPIVAPYMLEQYIQRASTSPEHLQFLHDMQITSVLVMPLFARGKALGALVACYTRQSGRHYTGTDVALAKELAAMVARAIDNARLYTEAQEEIARRRQMQIERNHLLLREREARARAELLAENLSQHRRWLERVLDLLPTPVMLIEPQRQKITFVNKAAHRLLCNEEPERNEQVRCSCFDLQSQHMQPVLALVMQAARGESVQHVQLDWETPTGCKTVLIGATLLHEMYGYTPRVLLSFLDITGLKDAERRKDEFIGQASHELRSPLAAIQANLQLVEYLHQQVRQRLEPLPAELGSQADMIESQLQSALRQVGVQDRLISDLLDASSIQERKLVVTFESCDLVQIVREVVHDFRVSAPGRTIRCQVSRERVQACVDPVRIAQVVGNYLSNALKYSMAEVEVGLRVEGEQARIWVRDRGQGLTPEQQRHVWERYYQAEGVQVYGEGGRGLGLGLHICRTIVELHQGSVGVESEPQKGSLFWCLLPLKQAAL